MDGFGTAIQWHNLFFAFIGVLIGTIVGTLPGIGPMSGVALLIPVSASLTQSMSPEQAAISAIILLAGVYYGAMYGSSTTSILLNTPGDSASVATTFDGYPMAKQGRAGIALALTAIASFGGGIISLIALILLVEPLTNVAIGFGPTEYFAMMFLGLTAVTGLTGKSISKAAIMTVLGLAVATIGIDSVSGVNRMTYGIPELYQGVEFLTIAVGLFAFGEVFKMVIGSESGGGFKAKITRILPTKKDLKESAAPIGRGSVLGFIIGVLPGAGSTIASFFAYTLEKKVSKNRKKLGTGAVEGVTAPEASNSASTGGGMIPLLALGIPGSGTIAVLLGAMIMYNVQPGPLLFEESPEIAWGLIASMFIGNLMLLILNLPLIKVFAKIVDTPTKYLLPLIIMFGVFGVYAVQLSTFNLFLLIACGVLGYFLTKHDFPLAPFVLGMILGPMIENNLRRALTISNGDYMVFLTTPISAVLLFLSIIMLAAPLISKSILKNINKQNI
ncbi:tripartite tricarboxylate transporter permease [Oceanobacillus jeddahense]|uniref:tripartite tricarboxylate transporter permease n=1 Tax=Oceanobacillus jeddahense TaxID=1462527 RepID=UPI00370951DE